MVEDVGRKGCFLVSQLRNFGGWTIVVGIRESFLVWNCAGVDVCFGVEGRR